MSDLNPYEEGLANDLAKAQARIEQLGKACAEWAEVSQSNYQRAKAAEAKLAKAVEVLNYCINAPFSGWTIAQGYARATLAEIESSEAVTLGEKG